jgi:hypothetical protein
VILGLYIGPYTGFPIWGFPVFPRLLHRSRGAMTKFWWPQYFPPLPFANNLVINWGAACCLFDCMLSQQSRDLPWCLNKVLFGDMSRGMCLTTQVTRHRQWGNKSLIFYEGLSTSCGKFYEGLSTSCGKFYEDLSTSCGKFSVMQILFALLYDFTDPSWVLSVCFKTIWGPRSNKFEKHSSK